MPKKKSPGVALIRYLERWKCPKGTKPTFTRMEGGKIYIPAEQREHFLDLWSAAWPFLPPAFNLIPVITRKTVFAVDLDVFTKSRVVIDDKVIAFARNLVDIVDNENGRKYMVLVCQKDEPYRKTKMVNGTRVTGWRSGAHVYVAHCKQDGGKQKVWGVRFSTQVRNSYYDSGDGERSEMECWCDGLDLLEPISEVWDLKVAKKTSFPMLIGSNRI